LADFLGKPLKTHKLVALIFKESTLLVKDNAHQLMTRFDFNSASAFIEFE